MLNLLIDGKNILYRSLCTSPKGGKDVDRFVIISRILFSYYNKLQPDRVHVFWDAPQKDVWRKKIYPEYKNGRNSTQETREDLKKYCSICQDIWSNMGIRQYYRDHMEADDLIYAFCKKVREPTIILSSDNDMSQIPYYFDHVRVMNPGTKKIEPRPKANPVEIKCLSGDKSDNIIGYKGIGEVRSGVLSEDINAQQELFNKSGTETYIKNMNLIDLSLCPHILENVMYVSKEMCSEIAFNPKAVKELLYKYKLRGMTAEYTKLILPFRALEEN